MSNPCTNSDHHHTHECCTEQISDDERARKMERAIEILCEAGADRERLRLLPKDGHDNKELAHFRLGEGALDADEVRHFEYTADEAVQAVSCGHPGFAVYYGMERYGTDGVLAIDVDERETFPYDETPDTATFVSGSGTGDHLLYENDGSVRNAVGKDGVEGEVRADRLYTVLPGSTHPSGGVYDIAEPREVTVLSEDGLPQPLKPSRSKVDGPGGEKIEIPRDPPEELEDAEFKNEIGWSLEQVRDKSEKLDRLLSSLKPGGYGGDRSKADAAAANYLWFYGFDRQQIGHILRKYRNYADMERDDYLYDHTIPFATGGERITEHYDEDGNYDPDPMATLPLARLDALSHEERRRYARKRGISWPGVDTVRERLRDEVLDAVDNGEMAVKSSPTGSGKTHTVATEPWISHRDLTDEQPVVHAHRTHEARDQARSMSDDAGVDAYTLKGRKELCPVAAGEHDPDNGDGNEAFTINGEPISEWIDHRCDRQGIPFSVVHGWAERETDVELPCERGDGQCPAKNQFEGIPRDDSGDPNYDVIHCTHQFLLVPSLRMHTHVFVDEKPAFGIDLMPDEVRASVNAYLQYIDAPTSDYSQLVQASRTGKDPEAPQSGTVQGVTVAEHNDGFRERMTEALNGENTLADCPECKGTGKRTEDGVKNQSVTAYPNHAGAKASNACPECDGDGAVMEKRGQPPLSWYRENPDAHALAPAFARAIWNAEETAGGRKHARVPYHPPRFDQDAHDSAAWNRVHVDVVLNDQWEVVQAESLPDFSLTGSVVGLDAHPQPEDPFWQANVHPDMGTDYTLDTEERTLYRRYERGLFTVQVGDGVQPVTSGEWLDDGQGKKFEAVVNQLRDHFGEDFDSAITSKSAQPFIRKAMEDAGVVDPEMMWYGNEESRNDFAGKNVGLVAGSIDPGDNMVVNLCARLGLDVEPCYKECPVCEGNGLVENDGGDEDLCETCTGEGEVRERGRTFDGEDADIADSVLKGVREHHVAQSAGRWARDAEDNEDSAMVFVITEAAPVGFIDAKAPGVTWTTNSEQRERLEYVRDSPRGATAKEVAEEFGCSKQAAWRTLSKAEEEGLLERTPGSGPYGADVYSPAEAFQPAGAVDLGPEDAETVAGGVLNTYTYTVTVDALPNCAFNIPEEQRSGWQHQTTFEMMEQSLPPTG